MYIKRFVLMAVTALMLAVSFVPVPAQAFRQEIDKDGNLTYLYFRDSDYSTMFDRIVYSAGAKVPDGMNSATTNYETRVPVIVNWYGDVNDECRRFRADLYYPDRGRPVAPKPELVNPNLPVFYQRIPVESYAGTFCKGDTLSWSSMERTVNETWVPGTDN